MCHVLLYVVLYCIVVLLSFVCLMCCDAFCVWCVCLVLVSGVVFVLFVCGVVASASFVVRVSVWFVLCVVCVVVLLCCCVVWCVWFCCVVLCCGV